LIPWETCPLASHKRTLIQLLTINSRANLLKNATEKEQRIVDLERDLKEIREAVAAKKKRLEDELTEERRKAVEATT
jgi:hypothetical protein